MIDPQPQFVAIQPSTGRHWKAIVIVLVFAVILGGGTYVATQSIFKNVDPVLPNMSESDTVTQTSPNQSACDNHQCLIAAAQTCTPISVVIEYKDMPVPLFEGVVASGKNKFDLNTSTDPSKCILNMQSLETVFSITESGKREALARGNTQASIDGQIKAMNDSAKEVAHLITKCDSTPDSIIAYLTDAYNYQSTGSADFKVSSTLDTTTYTTSTGQKLTCQQS